MQHCNAILTCINRHDAIWLGVSKNELLFGQNLLLASPSGLWLPSCRWAGKSAFHTRITKANFYRIEYLKVACLKLPSSEGSIVPNGV